MAVNVASEGATILQAADLRPNSQSPEAAKEAEQVGERQLFIALRDELKYHACGDSFGMNDGHALVHRNLNVHTSSTASAASRDLYILDDVLITLVAYFGKLHGPSNIPLWTLGQLQLEGT